MVALLFILTIVFVIISVCIYNSPKAKRDAEFPFTLLAIGAALIASIILLVCMLNIQVGVEEKIAVYQEQNAQIEAEVSAAVAAYMQHETDIYNDLEPESAITLVSLYPELKSDALISQQIDIYVANNNKITALKIAQVNQKYVHWWLYFNIGGDK